MQMAALGDPELEWPFRVEALEGRGMGCIATRDILLGERVLAESPLFTISKDLYYESHAIEAAVERLEDEQRARFYNLCQSENVYGRKRRPHGIFQNNALPLGLSKDAGYGLFPTAARLNHSCTPNVSHSYNSNLMKEMIHAGRLIKEGEELLTSYIQPDQTRERRQQYLKKHFGFLCDCSACGLVNEGDEAVGRSNERRSRLAWLNSPLASEKESEVMERLGVKAGLDLSLAHIRERIQLLSEEGLGDPTMLRDACYDAFVACKQASSHKEARKWLIEARSHCLLSEGADSVELIRLDKLISHPIKADVSGIR